MRWRYGRCPAATVRLGITSWSDRVDADRRRRRCRVLLIYETRRGRRYVTVLVNSDTGETLRVVAHRNAAALSGFWSLKATKCQKNVKIVVRMGRRPTGRRSKPIFDMSLMSLTAST